MTNDPRPTNAYTFPNGMLIVFDQFGQQMPAYQGPTAEKLPTLRAISAIPIRRATWHGTRANPIVPTGDVEP